MAFKKSSLSSIKQGPFNTVRNPAKVSVRLDQIPNTTLSLQDKRHSLKMSRIKNKMEVYSQGSEKNKVDVILAF